MNTRNISTEQGDILAALFRDHDDAEDAVKDLRDAGFSPDQIGVAGPHKGKGVFDKVADFFSGGGDETFYSDFAGSLSQLSISAEQARYFEQGVGQGNTLVTVRAENARRAEAQRILQEHSADFGTDISRQTLGTAKGREGISEQQSIRLLGETLRIHKDRVARGEVRLRKEVITEQQNVQVPVTREELVVERVPGNAREAAPGQDIGQGEEIRVPLAEERVRVEKKPIVNEEITVGKRQVQDTKNISEKVRREEVQVKPEGDVSEDEVEELPKQRRTA